MVTVTLITVGKMKEKFYLNASAEYIKRLGAYCKFQLIELPETRLPEEPNRTEIQEGLEKEAELIRQKLPKNTWFCVLTPEGKELSSEAFAAQIAKVKNEGRSNLCFLIGSSFGISEKIKQMADFRLSFGPMVFPHHLMRVMALEQIYRAETIQAGTHYHK